ncbi:unnamed protein product [Pleuronectes platessa]|uniref:Uncharacterized protein n=1 Tax=Pleuronectes platessa TaxID=8262 RepID=A0A9N7Y5S2_PLEPL|nr:unnamed protein product [Pleuronectes platessa]
MSLDEGLATPSGRVDPPWAPAPVPVQLNAEKVQDAVRHAGFSTLIRADHPPRTGGTEGCESAEGPGGAAEEERVFVRDLIHSLRLQWRGGAVFSALTTTPLFLAQQESLEKKRGFYSASPSTSSPSPGFLKPIHALSVFHRQAAGVWEGAHFTRGAFQS